MEPIPISLQLMDPNFKAVHTRAYTGGKTITKKQVNCKIRGHWSP
jgi:hypothetical protein